MEWTSVGTGDISSCSHTHLGISVQELMFLNVSECKLGWKDVALLTNLFFPSKSFKVHSLVWLGLGTLEIASLTNPRIPLRCFTHTLGNYNIFSEKTQVTLVLIIGKIQWVIWFLQRRKASIYSLYNLWKERLREARLQRSKIKKDNS